MAYSSVTDAQHRAPDARVNGKSGFDQNRPWWRKARNAGPAPAAPEHDTFPRPDAPTQAIPKIPAAAASPATLHRDEHTSPDQVALNMIRVCSQAMAEHWSATRLHQALDAHNTELAKRWQRELGGGRKIEERRAATAQSYADAAAAINAAVAVEQITGQPVDLDPEALGKGLAALSANVRRVDDRTLVGIPLITDGMPDPREALIEAVPASVSPSPVHVPGEALRPAVPHADEDASPGASSPLAQVVLLRRPLVTVLPAPMTGGDNPEPLGLHDTRPARGEVRSDDWVFDGSGEDAGVLKLVREVVIVRNSDSSPAGARVFFADGSDRRVRGADGAVQSMSARDAAVLVAAAETELDAMEASR